MVCSAILRPLWLSPLLAEHWPPRIRRYLKPMMIGHLAPQGMNQMFCITKLPSSEADPSSGQELSLEYTDTCSRGIITLSFFALPIPSSTGSPSPPPVEAAGKTEAATEPTLKVFLFAAEKLLPQVPYRGEALAGEH